MPARELIPDSECSLRGAGYSLHVAEQVVCCQAEGKVLYPRAGWNPKITFIFSLATLAEQRVF